MKENKFYTEILQRYVKTKYIKPYLDKSGIYCIKIDGVIIYIGKADNLYGDTTWVPMETTIEAIKRYGSKKMMFGSDMPIDGLDTYFCNPKGERSVYQDYFHVLPERIEKEAYEDLMWKNAVQIFRLKGIK